MSRVPVEKMTLHLISLHFVGLCFVTTSKDEQSTTKFTTILFDITPSLQCPTVIACSLFGDSLDEAVHSVQACGKDMEVLENFLYFGSVVHNDRGSCQEVL